MPAVASPLETLLALQDQDVLAAQLRHRLAHLPETAALAEIEGRIARLDAAIAETAAAREEAAGRRDALAAEVEVIGGRIERIEQQALSGAASYRDQEAMAAEVDSLRRRRREIEDDELEAMEVIEPLEAELARLESARQEETAAAAAARAALDRVAADVQGELAGVLAAREPIAAALPDALREEYERLAARLGGVAVARLVHNMCDGCRLQLPATEIDRIRRAAPDQVFHCEQCGRILVPARRDAAAPET